MKEGLNELPEVVDFAKKGLEMSGLTPEESAARGGTDGSFLTLRGLPTPNLGTGGVNYHSVREFISLEVMQKCTENIINIVLLWAENSKEVMPKINERRKKT
jgi:tripeptide aminopeptidase